MKLLKHNLLHKRNPNDGTIQQNWYLPAIDEIEEIVMSKYNRLKEDGVSYEIQNTYGRFTEFQDKYYWSCQPAFDKHFSTFHLYSRNTPLGSYKDSEKDVEGTYFTDNLTRARSTKVNYIGIVDGKPKYETVSSSTPGYSGSLRGDMYVTALPSRVNFDFDPQKGYGYASYNELDYKDHPGNKNRNEMARVRCVRKN